jgi:oligoribonuclease
MGAKVDAYLVWMDMEMSGLDPDINVVLEIATLITDNELNLIADGPVLAIHHDKKILDGMDDWNREHHGASGLTQRVLSSTTTTAEAEAQTLAFVRRYCGPRDAPLCGNSVYQDRRFLARYMTRPKLTCTTAASCEHGQGARLRWFPDGPKPPEKKHAHLALDIRESIEELRFYKEHYFGSEAQRPDRARFPLVMRCCSIYFSDAPEGPRSS